MSDFLNDLAQRSTAAVMPAVRPQLISLFEPLRENEGAVFSRDVEPARPAFRKEPGKTSDRLSQLESIWPITPERTATEITAQSPLGVIREPLSGDLPPAPAHLHGKERLIAALPAQPEGEEQEGAAGHHSNPEHPHEATAARHDDVRKGRPVDSVANPPAAPPRPLAPKSSSSRNISSARTARANGLTAKSDGHGNQATPRQKTEFARDETSIVARTSEPGEKKSSPPATSIERRLSENSAREGSVPGKVFPVRRIEPTAGARSSLPRVVSAQPLTSPKPEPSIHITIGRVEVRAALPTPVRPPPPRPPGPLLSLDEYLRTRAGGNRR